MTPTSASMVTTVNVTSLSTLQTSQSRAVDIPITTVHHQYDSSSQQRPLYSMCGYPTGGASLPPPPPQVHLYCRDLLICM